MSSTISGARLSFATSSSAWPTELTVPLRPWPAGVSSAGASSTIVVSAGLAEIVAGAISMGIGGFLAARSEVDHYDSEYQREVEETAELPGEERAEVATVFRGFGISGELLNRLVDAVVSDRDRWVEFMMRFELGLEKPDIRRAHERRDDRRGLHRRRSHSTRSLPARPQRLDGAALVGGDDPDRAPGLRGLPRAVRRTPPLREARSTMMTGGLARRVRLRARGIGLCTLIPESAPTSRTFGIGFGVRAQRSRARAQRPREMNGCGCERGRRVDATRSTSEDGDQSANRGDDAAPDAALR